MKQQFFKDNLENKFIKQLLNKTPLPLINTASTYDYLIKDCYYIIDSNVTICTGSGYLIDTKYAEFTNTENELNINEPKTKATYNVISNYLFGKYYPKFTSNYYSNTEYYDSDTHKHLGEYLRCIRDINKINLMPFYNCFNYEITSDFFIDATTPYINTSENNKYKIILVPIKFNKEYTIAIDNDTPVLTKAVFYNKLGLMSDISLDNNSYTYLCERLSETYTTFNHLKFSQPVKYKITNTDSTLQTFEKYLYLAIQLPTTNKSSIVVLEGDCTNCKNNIFNQTFINNNIENYPSLDSETLNSLLINKLSLLEKNDEVQYAFSEKLIEYLLLNVITNTEIISGNIKLVEKLVSYNTVYKGIWNDVLRAMCYNISTKDINNFYSLSGKTVTSTANGNVFNSISVSDSVARPLTALNIYGYCYQTNIPTPIIKADVITNNLSTLTINDSSIVLPASRASFSIDDIFDTYDIVSGTGVNSCNIIYCTGAESENWTLHGTYTGNGWTGYVFKFTSSDIAAVSNSQHMGFCNYFKQGLGYYYSSSNSIEADSLYGFGSGNYLFLVLDSVYGITTEESFRSWLASKTNFYIIYRKKVSSIVTDTPRTINFVSGSNTISSDKNCKIEAKYITNYSLVHTDKSTNINKNDLVGFIDKDTEKALHHNFMRG